MILLAIDTSTRTSGLALYDGLGVRYECVWSGLDYHGVDLAPQIQKALSLCGLKIKQLRAVGVAAGPGSYTGLRLGLALAKGLAFAHRLGLIAVPTLDILAAGQPVQDLPLVAVLQAGRGRLAVGRYKVKKERWQADGPPTLMNAEALSEGIHQPTLICGELLESDRAVLGRKYKNANIQSPAWSVRRPSLLAELAWERWQAGDVDDPKGLAPIYLQASEAVPL
ncbi:MAG TPA: tRNA (adenosine(37)-N6)-threonylcarbamoyltransferase complex dimerization subunit type 1 TsaB [Anaerolineales bacterium]|nr:tRNA (adenosine(37)-N6)-threonylcarbamoyltransferase complex dimerization subunit type 1 TsaB [Anaerolineales bacterium]